MPVSRAFVAMISLFGGRKWFFAPFVISKRKKVIMKSAFYTYLSEKYTWESMKNDYEGKFSTYNDRE